MRDDVTRQRVVFAALLDAEPVAFVEVFHFEPARKDVLVLVDLLLDHILLVVLVLDLAENLFQHVFERDDARRTAELVDHHGDVGAVLDEVFQQRLQRHGLRHEIGRHQHLPQIGRLAEQAASSSGSRTAAG